MNLKCLLLSSDDKTVRILRRVLGDLEISLDHCSDRDDLIRGLTRHRFEAIIVDATDTQDVVGVLRAVKAAPAHKRALAIALVESQVGLKEGFDMGAHFVLHKPLTVERAKSSFRAVRALMKRERRAQLRIPVQIPLECYGAARYGAKTVDLGEGGMAVKFESPTSRESVLRISFRLPGVADKLEIWGEMAWKGSRDTAGLRFRNLSPQQRGVLRDWLGRQLPEAETEPDDAPFVCRLTDLSLAACYLTSTTPFPMSTRIILSIRAAGLETRASGIVRITHPEFGMGVEFLQSSPEEQDQVRRMIETLCSSGASPEVHVEPDGLEPAPQDPTQAPAPLSDDSLVNLFHQKAHLSADDFVEEMHRQRQLQET
jgi:DNA-binding response OmpR family regulator